MNLSRQFWITMGVCGALVFILLWADHQAHILGTLPWLVLLACPLMHLFMHRGHHGHDRNSTDEDSSRNF